MSQRNGSSSVKKLAAIKFPQLSSSKKSLITKRNVEAGLTGAMVFCLAILVSGDPLASSAPKSVLKEDPLSQTKSASLNLTPVIKVTASGASGSSTNSAAGSNVSASVSTSTQNNGSPKSSVTINGQNVNVPTNGSTHQVISTPSGNTTVDVSHSQSASGTSTTNTTTSTNLDISSSDNESGL